MWFVLPMHTCAFPPVSNINSPYSHRHLLARSLCWLSFWWYGLRLVWMSPLRTSAHTCNGVECMGKESKTLSREMFAIYIHQSLKEYMQNSWHILWVLPPTTPTTCFCIQDKANLSWVEFFAGQAEATRMFRYGGHNAAKLDILYMSAKPKRQNPMDLCSDAGMGILG